MQFKIDEQTFEFSKRDKLLDLLLCTNNSKALALEEVLESPSLIRDISDLATAVNIDADKLLKCSLHKEKYQVRLCLNDGRIVYKSLTPLYAVQQYIGNILTKIYSNIDCKHLLAYINGTSYINTIKNLNNTYDILVSLDIKKYFDSITKQHISYVLEDMLGYNKTTALLFAKLLTVEGVHPIHHYKGNFLQQGSPASPVVSNLVGYFFYDIAIQLELTGLVYKLAKKDPEKEVKVDYYRYCDNLYIGIQNSTDIMNLKDFVSKVKEILQKAGFSAHKDRIVSRSNPHISQQILGITINNTPKINDRQFNNKKAALVNMLSGGLTNIENSLWGLYNNSDSGAVMNNTPLHKVGKAEKALQILQGEVNYYMSVNEKQGNVLKILKELLCSLFEKHKHNMEHVALDDLIEVRRQQEQGIEGVKGTGYAFNFVNGNSNSSSREQYIENVFEDILKETNIIQVSKLSLDKLSYVTNKVKELFKTSNVITAIGDKSFLNCYIPVTESNHKSLSSSIFKVINNYNTNGVLLENVISYNKLSAESLEVPVDVSNNYEELLQLILDEFSCGILDENTSLWKACKYAKYSTASLLIRIPIYSTSLSAQLRNLITSGSTADRDAVLQNILSGHSIIVQVSFIGADKYFVKQSKYQTENIIRNLYDKLYSDDISSILLKKDIEGQSVALNIPEYLSLISKSIESVFR